MQTQDTRPGLAALLKKQLPGLLKVVALVVLTFGAFAIVILVAGKDPIQAYKDIFISTLGSKYGFSEVLVRMTPVLLTALAVSIPANIGLINVGGEGQLYMGGIFAAWAALTFPTLPAWQLLPLVIVCGFIGGGLWAALTGFLRAKGWVSETISTMLLNYVAILALSFLVFGVWKDPETSNYPQTVPFVKAAYLPTFGGTRVSLGIVIALVLVVGFYLVLKYTRWGMEMRSLGGNPEAARRNGVPVELYMVAIMFIGGGIAGLAGMGEAITIQNRLRPSLSPGYGWTGFLAAWMAGNQPWGVLFFSFLLSIIIAGGDVLQTTQGLPFSVVNILMGLILFVVLARRGRMK